MRRLSLFLLVCVFLSSVVVSGCGLFGVDCETGVDFCLLFSGNCCKKKSGEFYMCGELDDPFVYPCGHIHQSDCACADIPNPFAPGAEQSRERAPIARATFGVPPFTLDVALPYAGFSAAHRLTFDVVIGDLQPFSGVVTYGPGFGFDGFTALGPAGTTIGSYGFDFGSDGSVDFTLPLRALTADSAYVDVNLDGQATVVDPTIQHVADVPTMGAHTFHLALPAGGDVSPNLARVFRAFRIQATLAAGIFTNPATPGSYAVGGSFTSIDPDTGDANDGTGRSPLALNVPPVLLGIAPSPLALLDHFLCYKTKPSKGLLCGAAAAVNAGGLCTTDAECGGVAGACGKNKWPKGVQLALGDGQSGFALRTADVTKPIRLCTPAENGEARHDTVTHLRAYALKDAKGSPPRVLSAPLRIVNPLGTFAVQVKAPDSLLEPAQKQLGSPAPSLGPNTVDRYQCYKAKILTKRCSGDPTRTCKTDAACGADGPCLGKFPKGVQVTLADQFTPGKRFDLVKPTRFCTPALANGDPVQSPDGHLLCFKVKLGTGETKHTPRIGTVHTTTALARERLDTVGEDELCVPSLDLSGS